MDRQYIKRQAQTLNSGKILSLFGVVLATTIFTLSNFNFIDEARDIFDIIRYGGHVGYYYGSFAFGASTMSTIIGILAIPVAVGMEAYFVKFIRTGKYELGEGIKFSYGSAFKNYGKFLWTAISTKIIIFLWSLLFIVPGVIANFKYYFVNKIIADNPSMSDGQARDVSDRMTNGYKGELFMLELSFIGWYILMGITFGLAGIYVLPYLNTTKALYYENCKNRAFLSGKVNPAEMIDPSLPSRIPPVQPAQPPFNQSAKDGYYQPDFSNQQPYQVPVEKNGPAQTQYQPPIEHTESDEQSPVDFHNNVANDMENGDDKENF